MLMQFKLSEFWDFLDDLTDICTDNEPLFTSVDKDDICLNVSAYRIVVPEIKRSFRIADLFCGDDAAGQGVVVEYPEDETNIDNYYSWSTAGLEEEIYYKYNIKNPDCIIYTDEFIDDSDMKRLVDSGEFDILADFLKQ